MIDTVDADLAARVRSVVDAGERTAEFLVVLGDTGTGKTALLDLAVEHARSGRRIVIAGRGNESEREHPFAGLRGLLQPLLSLDRAQDTMLREALLTWERTDSDPISVHLAASKVITAAALRTPIALIVDDVHHLDRHSCEALSHLCRHAGRYPLAVVLAARGQAAPPGIDAGLPELLLEPLALDAAAQLLDSQPNAPTGRSRREILRLAEGNPLAIVYFCRTGESGHLASTKRAEGAFHDEVRSLPGATRTLLVHAALAYGHPRLSVIAAATGIPPRLADWSPAERAEMVTISGDAVAFRHPLVRVAALRNVSASERRRTHAALAEALWTDAVSRAWHLAESTVGVDEDGASALEYAAEVASREGGTYEAACAFVRAAECSLEPDRQVRRYVKALIMANRLGDPDWIEQLADVVATKSVDADYLAIAACASSRVSSLASRQRSAFATIREAIHELRPSTTTTTMMRARIAAVTHESGLAEHRSEIIRLAAMTAAAHDNHQPHLAVSDGTELMGTLGGAAWFADEPDTCLALFRRMFDRLRRQGNESEFLDYFPTMICALIDTCHWDEAQAMISHGLRAAKLARSPRLDVEVTALRATLTAYHGNGPAASALLGRVWNAIDLTENGAAQAYLLQAAGIAAIASREWDDAYRTLRALFGPDGSPLHWFLSSRAIGHLAIAAWRTGRRDDAARVLLAVQRATGPRPTPRLALLMHHVAALVGDEQDAERHFRAALEPPEATRWPLARSLAVLHFSEWLRKQHRPVEARPLLIEAAESFSRLDAPHMVAWARNNMRATGVAATPPASASWSALTPQQLRMVRMAADGLRNREIAERLFLSPRTVAAHLHAAYSKLGVTGRSGLRDLVNSNDVDPEPDSRI